MTVDNFKPISELPEFAGELASSDQVLISKTPVNLETHEADNSNYESNRVSMHTLAASLSNMIYDSMYERLSLNFGDLTSINKEELEYTKDHLLTSFVPKDDAGLTSTILSNHAISAILWNEDKKIIAISSINLDDIHDLTVIDILNRIKNNVDDFDKDIVTNGLRLTDIANGKGIKIATINGQDVYSGDPKVEVNAEALVNRGEEIAKITYCDGRKVTIKNNLSVQQIPPKYGTATEYCGDEIANINGTVLKNNLNVVKINPKYGTATEYCGDEIANINGTVIKNNLNVTNTTTNGLPIGNINGKQICNGVIVKDVQNVGQPICTITNGGDTTLYNNVDVVDRTSENTNFPDINLPIAIINERPIYNGVIIKDDESINLTRINGHVIKAGIKLGEVQPLTNTGDLIAIVDTPTRAGVKIYSGINSKAFNDELKKYTDDKIQEVKDIINDLERRLTKYIDDNFLNKTTSTSLSVNGPVSYNSTITGTITNAIRANWT